MAKQEWTIRVINPIPYRPVRPIGHVGLPGIWVEQLRRLGVLSVIREYDGEHAVAEGAESDPTRRAGDFADGSEILEIYCPNPKGVDTKAWAEMNADRMKSFGINAAAAPKWGG